MAHFLHYIRPRIDPLRHICRIVLQTRPMSTTTALKDTASMPRITKYSFVSEPLGLPANQGYGWARIEFEQVLNEGEWVVKRKLGWGMSSSIWLAYDQQEKEYVAIKVLKGFEGLLRQNGHRAHEFAALYAVTVTNPQSPHCLHIHAAFNLTSESWDGNHVCYVTKLHGGNVERLAKHHRWLPLPLSKRILLHTLRGLAHTHTRGFIHTDLKLDNIFFDTNMSTEDITSLLISDSSRRHDPENSPSGMVQGAVSQPFPLPSLEDAMKRTFLLGDYSHAQPCSDPPFQPIAIPPHRPPENVILAPWNERSDIWQFGCLAFQLITGKMLFDWSALPKYNLTEEANLLYQMMNVTGEQFSSDYLRGSQKTSNYFNEKGDLLSIPPYSDDYRVKIQNCKHLSDAEITLICQLLSRCLRLNPNDRPSAVDLLSDPFFDGVD